MILKMKYKGLFCLLLVVVPIFTFGAGPDYFGNGNRQYAKGQYQQAIASYQHLIDEGYESAALYFNIGNACYKNDDIPSAIWYYEKAHKLAPGDDDINFNIRFANQKTTDRIDEAPEFFLAKWWRSFILMFSLNILSVLNIVLWILAGLALAVYLFTRSVSLKKTSFYSAISLFILGIVTIFMANRQEAYFDNHHQAIVFSGTVIVKSAPGANAKTLFVIHEGTKVDVLDTSNGRLKIRLANGNEGWIGTADVKEI